MMARTGSDHRPVAANLDDQFQPYEPDWRHG
jgi:hypothetical protein